MMGDPTAATEPAPTSQRGELERTLGLPQALAIGMGTMVGAGIFVFPGLAAGEAGPAAMLSFTIGAVIALLVALPASELATAMPESGGGYYFTSRGLGALVGCMVGIGQWLGLVFASAFYLMGFGYYLADMLQALQLGVEVPVTGIAFATAVLLTGISITGTKNAGNLQNGIVGLLLTILAVFLGYGLLDVLGVFGQERIPETFAPHGALPIFTTAALIFTSYLGFAQIATVAGEIKKPARNLPRAMVGSVVLVGLLYVLTIFISTSTMGSARLAELGETAIVEVARSVLGTGGAVAILGAGLLATLSSANASILSSSRSVYALSRDALLPEGVSRISRTFRTPHVALLLSGGPIAALILFGRVEVLAEVASLLHVVDEDDADGESAGDDVLGTVATLMAEEGINAGLIRLRVEVADDPGHAIINVAKDYNAVVLGETEPSVRDVIFGSVPQQIAREAEVPVMVVRRRHET